MTVMLDDAELFQVARYTRLRGRHARPFQKSPQFLLRPDWLRLNQAKNFLLSRTLIHSISRRLYAEILHKQCIDA